MHTFLMFSTKTHPDGCDTIILFTLITTKHLYNMLTTCMPNSACYKNHINTSAKLMQRCAPMKTWALEIIRVCQKWSHVCLRTFAKGRSSFIRLWSDLLHAFPLIKLHNHHKKNIHLSATLLDIVVGYSSGQQSVRLWRPFTDDNETNAHKS